MLKIVSFPKSGRTWLRYAAALAGLEPEFTHAGHGTIIYDIGVPFRGIPSEFSGVPVIFLHRNPLDTVVSYYFQILHKDCVPGRKTWAKMIDEIGRPPPRDINQFALHPHFGVNLILDFNAAWLVHARATPGSHVFTYEDFHANPAAEFARFFAALGHPEVDAAAIAEQTTFERMRELQASGAGDIYRIRQAFKADPQSAKVREGKVGGYVNHLSAPTISRARRIIKNHPFTRGT